MQSHKGSSNPRSKLAESDVRVIRERLFCGVSAAKIALSYEVSSNAVLDIRHGRTWGHLPPCGIELEDAVLWRRKKRDVVSAVYVYQGADLCAYGASAEDIQEEIRFGGFCLQWSCGDHYDLFCSAAPDRVVLGDRATRLVMVRRFHRALELPPCFYGVSSTALHKSTDQTYADPEFRPAYE